METVLYGVLYEYNLVRFASTVILRRGLLAHHRSTWPAVVLTYSIPYLQLDWLSINSDHACSKLNANRQVVHGLKPLVCELKQEAGLANTCK